MTNLQILEKVIKRVNKNGLDCELSGSGRVVKIFRGKEETNEMPTITEFIFSHEFAKTFWKNEIWKIKSGKIPTRTLRLGVWQSHLQTMVLCKNPIKYLGRFIK